MSSKNAETLIKVKYTRSDIRGLGPDVRLYPCDREATVNTEKVRAYNLVPVSVLQKFERHPQIRGLVADGSIVVLGPEESESAPSAPAERKPRKKTEKPSETEEAPAPPEGSEAASALKSLGLA